MTTSREALGLVWLLLLSLPGCGSGTPDAPPPNILLLTLDDLGLDSVSCYGCPLSDATPNIDALARQGMRFDRFSVTTAACQPSRAVLMTGRYPHRNGALGFEPISADVPLLTDSLHDRNYFCAILGKVDHLEPVKRFRWDVTWEENDLGKGRDADLYGLRVAALLSKANDEKRPFFLLVNAHDPHRPFSGSEDERLRYHGFLHRIKPPSRTYRPEEVAVPGFLPDLPDVRIELAHYQSSVRRADDVVGEVLRALDEAGLAESTIVVLLSDNGMSFPFAKTTCYPQGTRVPFIVRWPGRVGAGSVDSRHLVSGIDVLPTLLEAAGIPAPAGIDGRSFLPVLEGRTQKGRDRVFTTFHETIRDRAYPTRCVEDPRLAYLYNAWSDGKTRFLNEGQQGLTMAAMERQAERDPELLAHVRQFLYRTKEELYDLERDPFCLHNLADDPGHAKDLVRLQKELLAFMERTGDPLRTSFSAHLDGTE